MGQQNGQVTNGELGQRIRELIKFKGGGDNEDLVQDLIENALKILGDVKMRGDVRVIQTAVRELRYAFRLFEPYEETRKVTIFGSARTSPDRSEYKKAAEFAEKMVHKLITFKYFFTRKLTFIRQSDAIVLFPGGFGTMDEGFEALTLMQTGKSRLMPFLLVDKPGGTYWKSWEKYVQEHLLRNGLISDDDLNLYEITDDVDHAVRVISRFYRNYHSSRFVRDLYVIRLNHQITDTAIKALNEDFSDIIIGEPIHAIEATPDEREDNYYVDLPRIAFTFNQKDYGRLRELINVLNGM
jgi:predicted Rossmann-fold nucleotide-binding protein